MARNTRAGGGEKQQRKPRFNQAAANAAAIEEHSSSKITREPVKAKTEGQKEYMGDLADPGKPVVICLGPAGSGKTFLAIAAAVEAFKSGAVGRIVLTRPAVEAGEKIGFLPGDIDDKLDPYLRPLYDALQDRLGNHELKRLKANGEIEIAPVGYLRGRTLNNAFIVVDEAQNMTYTQLKMLLTRLGYHSKMVVTGDPKQVDLKLGESGFAEAAEKLKGVPGIAVRELQGSDIVRSPVVISVLDALDGPQTQP
jgi:phosphate starvation-inducible protein PhoH and related proteins